MVISLIDVWMGNPYPVTSVKNSPFSPWAGLLVMVAPCDRLWRHQQNQSHPEDLFLRAPVVSHLAARSVTKEIEEMLRSSDPTEFII